MDPHFGGDEALAKLTEELHANGMRIILDVSINHTGSAHKWFNRDADFFDKSVGAYNNPDAAERKYYFFGEGNTYKAWWGVDAQAGLPRLPPSVQQGFWSCRVSTGYEVTGFPHTALYPQAEYLVEKRERISQ